MKNTLKIFFHFLPNITPTYSEYKSQSSYLALSTDKIIAESDIFRPEINKTIEPNMTP